MKYEKAQKGNPYQLTIKQHIFPKKSIERFTNDNGKVEICLLKPVKKNDFFKPDNVIFCTKRTWAHGDESGYMKDIEDKFQDLAESIINGNTISFGLNEINIINEFFSLWVLRSHYMNNPVNDQMLHGIKEDHLTKDIQEKCEKNGVGFCGSDSTIPGRQMTGLQIQKILISLKNKYKNVKWIIVKSDNGEFIVPDIPPCDIIPITPNFCLLSKSKFYFVKSFKIVKNNEVRKINKMLILKSEKYYFARDFSKCPL